MGGQFSNIIQATLRSSVVHLKIRKIRHQYCERCTNSSMKSQAAEVTVTELRLTFDTSCSDQPIFALTQLKQQSRSFGDFPPSAAICAHSTYAIDSLPQRIDLLRWYYLSEVNWFNFCSNLSYFYQVFERLWCWGNYSHVTLFNIYPRMIDLRTVLLKPVLWVTL